jgi:hypothetical protein
MRILQHIGGVFGKQPISSRPSDVPESILTSVPSLYHIEDQVVGENFPGRVQAALDLPGFATRLSEENQKSCTIFLRPFGLSLGFDRDGGGHWNDLERPAEGLVDLECETPKQQRPSRLNHPPQLLRAPGVWI